MNAPHVPKHGTPLEHAIVRALLEELDNAGYKPVQVWDGGAYVATPDERSVLDAVFSVVDSTIHFAHKVRGEDCARGVLVIVGNEQDCISDFHTGDRVFSDAIDGVYDRIQAGHRVVLAGRQEIVKLRARP